MAEMMHLLGAEDVLTASHAINAAAHEMTQVAAIMETALLRHERFLDDWLNRFEAAQTRLKDLPTETKTHA